MALVPAAVLSLLTLAAAGLLPAVALSGRQPVTVVLAPLAGSALAGLAASCFLALGWSFIGWFALLAVVAALAVWALWQRWPDSRPWRRETADWKPPRGRAERVLRIAAVVGILVATAWSLRSLATPTVGFDARAIWLLRSGWFLQSHHQLLLDLRTRDIILVQTPYPPLVSAAAAVAWKVDGQQSMRLGVVVVALLNTCALVAAALAVLDAGRVVVSRVCGSNRARAPVANGAPDLRGPPAAPEAGLALLPAVVAGALAILLVFVGFGITEPFMTNGYADPLWSLAALGALAYGLQLPVSVSNAGVAGVLAVVAGMSKNEGLAAAAVIVVLVAARRVAARRGPELRIGWRVPVAVAVAELAAIGVWPFLMRVIHARGVTETYSSISQWSYRARVTYDGMSPYLHVVVLAVPVAVVGALVLRRVRRIGGLANDGWAWAGISGGLLTVVGTLITGTVAIVPWVQGSAHRTTEFPALVAWWILAFWAIVAASAPATIVGAGEVLGAARTVDADTGACRRPEVADPVTAR